MTLNVDREAALQAQTELIERHIFRCLKNVTTPARPEALFGFC